MTVISNCWPHKKVKYLLVKVYKNLWKIEFWFFKNRIHSKGLAAWLWSDNVLWKIEFWFFKNRTHSKGLAAWLWSDNVLWEIVGQNQVTILDVWHDHCTYGCLQNLPKNGFWYEEITENNHNQISHHQ